MLLNILLLHFALTQLAQPKPYSSSSILLHISNLKAPAGALLMR